MADTYGKSLPRPDSSYTILPLAATPLPPVYCNEFRRFLSGPCNVMSWPTVAPSGFACTARIMSDSTPLAPAVTIGPSAVTMVPDSEPLGPSASANAAGGAGEGAAGISWPCGSSSPGVASTLTLLQVVSTSVESIPSVPSSSAAGCSSSEVYFLKLLLLLLPFVVAPSVRVHCHGPSQRAPPSV